VSAERQRDDAEPHFSLSYNASAGLAFPAL